jgi:hypothetical protein
MVAGESLPSRLLKKAHLRRCRVCALVAAYLEYASLGSSRGALHLDLFEQPGEGGFFSNVLGFLLARKKTQSEALRGALSLIYCARSAKDQEENTWDGFS